MTRGPLIHGVLLLAALVFAYQTWTREEVLFERFVGDIKLWKLAPDSITALVYDSPERSMRFERRKDELGTYLWGIDTRAPAKPKKVEPTKPESNSDASVGGHDHAHGAAADPAKPAPSHAEPEPQPTVNEFPLNVNGVQAFEDFADMRALRSLGKLTEEDLKKYELADSKQILSVIYEGGTKSLILGGQIYSGIHRYALDPETNNAYVVAGDVLKNLINGFNDARELKAYKFKDDELAKIKITVGDDKTIDLVRVTIVEGGKEVKTWGRAETPGKPDQTLSNFVVSFNNLDPAKFEPKVDISPMTRKLRFDYYDSAGKSVGWIELFEDAPKGQEPAAPPPGTTPAAPGTTPAAPPGDGTAQPDGAQPAASAQAGKDSSKSSEIKYYIRSPVTRGPAAVLTSMATRIIDDIEQILAQ